MEEEEKKPKSDQEQVGSAAKGAVDAGGKAIDAGKSAVNTGKKAVEGARKVADSAKKTAETARKTVEMARKAVKMTVRAVKALAHMIHALVTAIGALFNPVTWIVIGIIIVILIVVVGITWLINEFDFETVIEDWTATFMGENPDFGEDEKGSNTQGAGSMVEAAKAVHAIIEKGYTYGSGSDGFKTVEESEAAGNKTVNCSGYVDWVLARVNPELKLPSRLCDYGLKAGLDAADWCENIGTNPDQAEAGDIVLFSGHIQIYGGNEGGSPVWFNAGSTTAIQTPAPSDRGTSPWSRGPIGIYRVKV